MKTKKLEILKQFNLGWRQTAAVFSTLEIPIPIVYIQYVCVFYQPVSHTEDHHRLFLWAFLLHWSLFIQVSNLWWFVTGRIKPQRLTSVNTCQHISDLNCLGINQPSTGKSPTNRPHPEWFLKQFYHLPTGKLYLLTTQWPICAVCVVHVQK